MKLHHPLRVGAMRPTPIIEIGCAAIGTAETEHGTGSVSVIAGGRKPIQIITRPQ